MVAPIIVSYSELDTFRQCPLKHAVLYGKRYTKPSKADGALARGTLYHNVLETHYKIIKAWQDKPENHGKIAIKDETKVLKEIHDVITPMLISPSTGEPWSGTHDLIYWMYNGYVENYGADLDWRIMAVEHQIITPLPNEQGRASRYHLKAKLDLILRDRSAKDSLWVLDHKSGKDLPSKMDLEIDDQFGLYTWAMQRMGRSITGTIHSANRTQRNKSPMALDQRMGRTYLNRSKPELANLALDAYRVARAAHPPKSEQRPPYSSPDPRSCGWKCDIKEPHLLMRQGRPMHQVLTEYGFKIDKTRH